MFRKKTIAVIGAGNMGEILIQGLLAAKVIDASRLSAVEILPDRREYIEKTHGISVSEDMAAVRGKNIVIIAVKPQVLDATLAQLKEILDPKQLLISIAAGISTERIANDLGCKKKIPVVRVMPNACAQVLQGASALFAGEHAGRRELDLAKGIFDCVGRVTVVKKEWLMDVVTGLSGSGPAYVFLMIEALSDAGVQIGLPRKVANMLAAQTVYGAGKMFLETGKPVSELKDLVATPGGTTFAGLKALEKGNFRSTVGDAVEAAAKRSRELGLLDPSELLGR
jgi:pyrroline-5-carboxylate reductase